MDKKNVSVPLSSVPNRFRPVEGVVKRERDDLNENGVALKVLKTTIVTPYSAKSSMP